MGGIVIATIALTTAAGCDKDGRRRPKTAELTATRPTLSMAELARGTVEQRLASVEAELEARLRAGASEAERKELTHRRLVLTVAIAELSRRIDAGDRERIDVERLLSSVELALREPAGTGPGGRGVTARNAKETATRERDRRILRPLPKSKDKASRTNNTIEEELPDDGLEPPPPEPTATAAALKSDKEEGGRIEKARVEVESRPRGLMTAVRRQLESMEACLGHIDDDLRLQVTVRMDSAGAVRNAQVRGVTGGVAGCISDVLRRVRVRDHDGSARIVRFPLFFQP